MEINEIIRNNFTRNKFTRNKFTGNKDIDRIILLSLHPKDMLSLCQSSKYLNSICDEEFFQNKIRGTALERPKKFYPDLSYKLYYVKMMYYIGKLKEDYNYDYDLFDVKQTSPVIQYDLIHDSKNFTDLFSLASNFGEFSLVKYAVKMGANIHHHDDISFIMASAKGETEIVKFLLEHGAKVNAQSNDALMSAIEYDHLDVIKLLVKFGINIHFQNERALRFAAKHGKLDIVKYLVEQGANPHVNNNEALISAALNGKRDVAEYLENLP